ncbi:MAG: oligosaccharide flippase family protein [Desulfarculaceae bacterium]|nr:oligosaccharide flippase family protein [Desulfarculaceae bacterium]
MGTFFSNISKLTLSKGLSIGLGLAATPIVARLYAPEFFGVYGLVSSVATWISAFIALGYYQAIPLATSRGEARTLTRLCLIITTVLTLIAVGIFGVGGRWVAEMLNEPVAAPFMWFVPALFLVDSLQSTADGGLAREGRFGTVSVVSFLNMNLARLLTILWAVFLGAGVMGLFMGNLMGTMVGVVISLVVVAKALWEKRENDDRALVSYAKVIKDHIQFPKINLWNGVLRVSTSRAPVFVLAAYFDPATVGFFTFASSIVSMPLRILGTSVSQVFYPEAAREWEEEGAVKRALHFAVKFQATVGVFPLTALALLAPLFFEVVFGWRWREAGVMCQIISFWMFMNFLTTPIMPLFLIRKEAGVLLFFSIAQLAVTVIALLLGGYLGSPRLALALFSGGTGLVYLFMLIKTLRAGKAQITANLWAVVKELIFALATLAPATVVYYTTHWRWIPIGLCVLGALAYTALLYWRDREIHDRVKRIMRRLPMSAGDESPAEKEAERL